MQKDSGGIYSIVSKTNGKRYIGSALNFKQRWKNHLKDLRINNHHSSHLQNHFNKYGEEDLIFSIVEILEKDTNISTKEYKDKLLKSEQKYLDDWNNCHFNILKLAGSSSGYKKENSKYYSYQKSHKAFITHYKVNGKTIRFRYHLKEEDAIAEVNYIKTLNDNELLEYKKECKLKNKRQSRKEVKGYYYNSYKKRWEVIIKSKRLGLFLTEQEAIEKVNYFKNFTIEELEQYLQNKKQKANKDILSKKRVITNYHYNKKDKKYHVRFTVKGVRKYFGHFLTEQEAIDAVTKIKEELSKVN